MHGFFFVLAALLTIGFTLFLRFFASKINVVDRPDGARKRHERPIPLLGGVGVMASFWILVAVAWWNTGVLSHSFHASQLVGVFFGCLVLLWVGVVDDWKPLSPRVRFVCSIIAVLIALIGGVGLSKITNPFGGVLPLTFGSFAIGNFGTILPVADALVFVWLMGMIYTTKILDGLDGLATGITLIGACIIYFLAETNRFHQPQVALLAIIFAGALSGFLLFNFSPATIFLGESGGLCLGYVLGVLAVISGGKIATALLVMAIPILDFARVIFVRLRQHRPLFQGDREHLHFRLLEAGFSHRESVLILYAVALIFGALTFILPSTFKLAAFAGLFIVVFVAGFYLKPKVK